MPLPREPSKTVQAQANREIARRLESDSVGVRLAVVRQLATYDAKALVIHAAPVSKRFRDSDADVRSAAIVVMKQLLLSRELPPHLIERFTIDVVNQLEDPTARVRCEVVQALAKLHSEDLAPRAALIVEKFGNASVGVRWAAITAMGGLDLQTFTAHAAAVAATLEDSDAGIRWVALQTLRKLNPLELKAYAAEIIAKLEDPDMNVRYYAARTLCSLEADDLETHAATIVAKLEHSNVSVRWAAVHALAKLDQQTLNEHNAVTKLEGSLPAHAVDPGAGLLTLGQLTSILPPVPMSLGGISMSATSLMPPGMSSSMGIVTSNPSPRALKEEETRMRCREAREALNKKNTPEEAEPEKSSNPLEMAGLSTDSLKMEGLDAVYESVGIGSALGMVGGLFSPLGDLSETVGINVS